jgi:YHS domain-containing protein
MKTHVLKLVTLFLVFGALFGEALAAGSTANLDKSGVILQGYDAVSYFKSEKPQKGDSKFRADYDGATYFFANEENKTVFLKSPTKYAPQYGGWCAYAIADSKSKVDIDPTSFLIQDGKLLLFYKGLWGDTRKKWQKNAKTFLKMADTNWPEVEKKEP